MNIVAGKKPHPNTNLNVATNRPFRLAAHFRKYYPNMKVEKVRLKNKDDIYRLYKTKSNQNAFVNIKHNIGVKTVPRYKKIYAARSILKDPVLLQNRAHYFANYITNMFSLPQTKLIKTVERYVKSKKKNNKRNYYNTIVNTMNTYKNTLNQINMRRKKFTKTLERYKSL